MLGRYLKQFKDINLTFRGLLYSNRVLRKTQYMTKNQLVEFQVTALKQTLIHSYERIPFYQKLFWNHDFDPYNFTNLSSLSCLPVLSKESVLSNPADFYSSKYINKSVRLTTSGTTGNPMVAFASERQWVVEQAAIWRHWSWAGYRFRDKMAIVRSYAPKKGEPLIKYDHLRNWLYMSPYHLDEPTVLSYLQTLIDWQPKILRGYPSSLYLLARIARIHNIQLPSLKVAFTASEVLSDDYRFEIEKAFDVHVFDHYGQAEITTMLQECEQHSGMHILEDYAYTELLPSDTKDQYRLIATNLFNESMPLIRYETGDLVIPEKVSCSCGRNFPLVKNILGRPGQLLVHHDGYYLPSVNFYTFFSKRDEVFRFQIIQSKADEIKILIKFREDKNNKICFQEINDEMNLRFGCPVELVETNEFITSGEGKFNAIIQKVNIL